MAQRLAQKTHGEEAHVREGELKRIFSEAKKHLSAKYFGVGGSSCPQCCGSGSGAVLGSSADVCGLEGPELEALLVELEKFVIDGSR